MLGKIINLRLLGSIGIIWSYSMAVSQSSYGTECYCGWYSETDKKYHCQRNYDGLTREDPYTETACDSLCKLRYCCSEQHYWGSYGPALNQCHKYAANNDLTVVDDPERGLGKNLGKKPRK